MGIIVAYSIATFFTAVFACVPVAKFWNRNMKGTCVDETAVWYVSSAKAVQELVIDHNSGSVTPVSTSSQIYAPRFSHYPC